MQAEQRIDEALIARILGSPGFVRSDRMCRFLRLLAERAGQGERVKETEIGVLGCAICYDWLFPEAIRELALQGAEVLIRVSAYMDPWGATPPMDWWTVVNRCRALENTAFVVAANQGAGAAHYRPFSWPGGSMVVDYDGRVLAQAAPEGSRKEVVAGLKPLLQDQDHFTRLDAHLKRIQETQEERVERDTGEDTP